MSSLSEAGRRKIAAATHSSLSLRRRCDLVSVHRSSLYYQSKGESELNLELMRKIDQQYLKHPEWGSPSMTCWLREDCGYQVNVKRVARLMRLMCLQSLQPGPHTSKSRPEHRKYPYLLRDLEITRANQVWQTDITYIPVAKGFLYLMAVIDVYSRYVVHWSVSNTMDGDWCCEVMEEAIGLHGVPEIVNTDQGSQFTSLEFTGLLESHGISISMDGKGRATDNAFIERLWRSVKYEHVYLHAYPDGRSLRKGLSEYFDYYNHRRRHSSLEGKVPFARYASSRQAA